jgi:rare lipoprotein A
VKKLFLVLPLLFLFLGCGSKKKVTLYIPPANSKTHGGVWESRYVEIGIASWYGPGFHGRRTASGEIYNMYAYTAAHKTLPLGTYVRVINLENGKSVVVRINDRGPFKKGRIIDLSYAAAKKIGMIEKGTARVRLEILSKP